MDEQTGQATDSKILCEQIMKASVPKNEREWWAHRRIADLEYQLKKQKKDKRNANRLL